jgi:membrane-anchored protein YejM (alkaline phosphatase superfamily)
MVLNILTSPDAIDSIQTGSLPLLLFLFLVIVLVWFEFYVIKRVDSLDDNRKKRLNSNLNRTIILPLILIVLSEKVTYGLASLFSKNEIVSKFKVIPLYQPLTFRRIAAKHFGFKAKEQAKYSIKRKADLNYPLKPLTIDSSSQKFNIFIIASDSLKYSILDEEIAPNITEFSKDSLVFDHHYSGGNSTRFGIFSLIYGLNSTYWFSFLNANQKPVLFDILKQLNYQIDIFSSTNTNWPEFRKTCYVDIQPSIHDNFKGDPWEKDEQSTALFLDSLESEDSKFRFAFLFLDAPHGYSYPPSYNRYHAPEEEINYLSISKGSDALKSTVKRYKNAVYYNDMLFGKIIKRLKDKKFYDNALIILTSDHGQEFFEYGNFGHNTSFSEGQIHIPFIVKLPKFLQNRGLEKSINGSLTSHQDVVPSLLSLLGVSNSASEYSNGRNFFSESYKREYIFSSNWNNNAIVTEDKTYLFSNLPDKIFSNEVYDSKSYKKLSGQKSSSRLILDSMNENKKFLK